MRESFSNPRSGAIFAAREDASEIMKSIAACRDASKREGLPAICDVLVNGNRRLVDDLQHELFPVAEHSNPFLIRVWYIAVPDKAHTWNIYLEHIWPQAEVAHFVDGYAQPHADSFSLLS